MKIHFETTQELYTVSIPADSFGCAYESVERMFLPKVLNLRLKHKVEIIDSYTLVGTVKVSNDEEGRVLVKRATEKVEEYLKLAKEERPAVVKVSTL